MNDDEYDFDFTDNSRLSALFGKDSETGNSSLTYKAPKQPGTLSSSTSKTFHKYIKLYQNHSGELYGKYIIAIVTLDSNNSEMLIYQTKKFIFIRQPIVGKVLYTHTNNNTLILNANEQQFKLEFENGIDHLDFSKEYVMNGGLIELFKTSNSSQHDIRKKVTEIEYPEESEESINHRVNLDTAKNERNGILTRFEKMGLPQLLPIQIEKEEIKNDETTINNSKPKGNENFDVLDDAVPKIFSTKNKHEEDDTLCQTLRNNKEETDLLTSVLMDIQTKNSQLKEAICLLTSRLNEIIPNNEDNSRTNIKKLESKIKSLELKSENLQCELKNLDKKYIEKNKSKFVHIQNKDMHDISSQTDRFEYIHNEALNLEPIVIQVLDIFKSHSFTSEEVSKLKNYVHGIGDDQVISKLQPYFNVIEEKNISKSNMRNTFVSELKVTMNNMYQNISGLEESDDFNDLLVKKIKQASSDILKIFDNLLQKVLDH